jgi:2-oxoisovalerate dehydrogenase E1 component
MKPFSDREEMVRILTILWDKILSNPQIIKSVGQSRILVKFRLTDPDADLYVDTRGAAPRFYWDPKAPEDPDVEMILSGQTSHLFWMEQLNVPLAIASRKIIAKGSIQKALKLMPALKPAFALYPGVLQEAGRGDLLEQARKVKKRRRFSWLPVLKKRGYDLAALGSVPLTLVDTAPKAAPRPAKAVKSAAPRDLDILKTMLLVRAFEEHLSTAFRAGAIPTEAIHLSIGQEAVAAGVCLNLRPTDYLNTTHRGHGHVIAKGADIAGMMAEIYGKASGLCSGKGGSMHVTDSALGILGANGIVGAGYLLAMGAALTIKKEGRDDVSVVIAGDGSVNQGMFHEAANMAAVFNLPVLFVIENNRYGEFTSVERHSAQPEIYKRAAAYNIEAIRADGNDVREVFEKVGAVIEKIRRDKKPRLVELMTYRWHGHMEGEPESYRSAEEKERYKKECPIKRFSAFLAARGASPEDIDAVRQEAAAVVAAAVRSAEASPEPALSTLTEHTYAPDDRSLFEGAFLDEPKGRLISVGQAVNEALAEEMERDGRVFIWGEDVTLGGYFNVTEGLVDRFGSDRVIDTPISENGIIGGAVGAAVTGLVPVPEILFSDFLTCAMDPILNQAAKIRYMTGGQVSVPLTIRTPVGGGIGMAAQHSQSMERFFFGIPGLITVAPSDPYTAKGILKAAIRSQNPVIVFEHKLLYPQTGVVPDGDYTLPLGKARIVRRGDDVTIVTHLLGVGVSLEAAKLLDQAGIQAEIVDLVTLYPLDMKTVLDSLQKTGTLVSIEEGSATGGIGSEVIARTARAGLGLLKKAPVLIAAPECPIAYAKGLETAMIPSPEFVADEIRRLLARR